MPVEPVSKTTRGLLWKSNALNRLTGEQGRLIVSKPSPSAGKMMMHSYVSNVCANSSNWAKRLSPASSPAKATLSTNNTQSLVLVVKRETRPTAMWSLLIIKATRTLGQARLQHPRPWQLAWASPSGKCSTRSHSSNSRWKMHVTSCSIPLSILSTKERCNCQLTVII